ncbi:MAG TPA: hypothetical protein VLU91_03225 [Nitrososphaerales archaeon]|nr:hypothetical protein [Nitrososphaerales archaeon]
MSTTQLASPRCNRCGQEIIWMRNGVRWIPYNPVGTRHRCTSQYYGR